MKKLISFGILAILLASCKKDGEYSISGSVEGLKTGKVVLEKQAEAGMGFIPVDTVDLVDGKFEMKGKILGPEMYFVQVENVSGKVPFILEEGKIGIEVNKDSILKSKTSGTYSNDEFYKFQQDYKKIQMKSQKKVMEFQMKNMAKMNEAQMNNDTVVVNSLRNEYRALQKEMTDYLVVYAEKNPKSYMSLLIIQSMVGNPEFPAEKTDKFFNSLDKTLKESKLGKKITEKMKEDKGLNEAISKPSDSVVKVGNSAPDFTGKTPEGKVTSLKQNLGKVTIIDFWASWCGPCRTENPSVVALYNEFHSKGLNIVGVSLDEKGDKWKEAIAKDKITWVQISNLKGWDDPIAKQYNVNEIPSTYILDEKGVVIAVNLRGEELKKKVASLL
jgi:thiol-disulfide isomerase/thioredoxin